MEIPNRDEHAADMARDVARLFARQRRELLRLLGDPADWHNVPDQFWRDCQREFEQELATALLLILMISMEFHGDFNGAGGDSGFTETAAQAQAQRMATSQARLVAADFASTSPAWLRAAPPEAIPEATDRIFSPIRAAGYANDQTTWAQTQGGETAIAATVGISDEDLWLNHPNQSSTGPCQTCAPLHLTPRSYWGRFFPGGPPDPHPHCVCTIQYANVNKPQPASQPGQLTGSGA